MTTNPTIEPKITTECLMRASGLRKQQSEFRRLHPGRDFSTVDEVIREIDNLDPYDIVGRVEPGNKSHTIINRSSGVGYSLYVEVTVAGARDARGVATAITDYVVGRFVELVDDPVGEKAREKDLAHRQGHIEQIIACTPEDIVEEERARLHTLTTEALCDEAKRFVIGIIVNIPENTVDFLIDRATQVSVSFTDDKGEVGSTADYSLVRRLYEDLGLCN